MSEKMFIVGLALGMVGGALIVTNSKKVRQMVSKSQDEVIKTAEKLSKITVKILAGGGTERLYGTITTKDISEALAKNHGISIDKKKMMLSENIKTFGTYKVDVKLYGAEITGTITVQVSPKQ